MSWNDPSSHRRSRYPVWPPPDPSTRIPSPLAADPLPQASRRRHTAPLLAALIGFVVAATLVIGLVGRSSIGSGASRNLPTPPVAATSPTVGPREASNSVSLSAGVVLVTTVLGFQQGEAAGTGVVLTSNGEVLTNNHVVNGSTQVSVTIPDGRTYAAAVVGTDPTADIAVLQIANASGLATATIGHSTGLQVGDAVVGLGNALGRGDLVAASGTIVALEQTVTAADQAAGTSETLHHLIETSAQLQPGDSGGPLFDDAGAVIGIDTIGSIGAGRRSGGRSAGDSFAIPIDSAIATAKLIEAGQPSPTITIGTPPLLGISADQTASADHGVAVTFVGAGTPAETIGLQIGDVITKVDGTTITSLDGLTTALHAHHAGDGATITWTDTGGAEHSATATLVAGPAD